MGEGGRKRRGGGKEGEGEGEGGERKGEVEEVRNGRRKEKNKVGGYSEDCMAKRIRDI